MKGLWELLDHDTGTLDLGCFKGHCIFSSGGAVFFLVEWFLGAGSLGGGGGGGGGGNNGGGLHWHTCWHPLGRFSTVDLEHVLWGSV